jgi:hypothetical protein
MKIPTITIIDSYNLCHHNHDDHDELAITHIKIKALNFYN